MATFKVWVNGKPVSAAVDYKAILGDRDITAQLRELGWPDKQIFQALDLTKDQQATLDRLVAKKGALLLSNWKVSETAFWPQKLSSRKRSCRRARLRADHWRRVSVPYQKGVLVKSDLPSVQNEGKTDDVCLDDVTRLGIEKQIKAQMARRSRLHLCFLAGRRVYPGLRAELERTNRRVHAEDQEQAPDQIVSLCFPGKPKKISPTILEFVQKDFVPAG